MKAIYEAVVSGNSYDELVVEAWKEVSNLFKMSVEEVKEYVTAEMHIRKNIETADKKYSGSLFFGIDPFKSEKKEIK